jgi:plastocyanin
MQIRTMLTLGAAGAALALAAPAGAQPAATHLTGTVGPGFTISLGKGGAKVKTLTAGRYEITVSDKASVHDFHLIGPGVNRVITSVAFTGTKKVELTLEAGTYTYECDPHAASGMKATFKVTAAAAAPAPVATTGTGDDSGNDGSMGDGSGS